MLKNVKNAEKTGFSGYLPAVAALLVFYLIVYFGFDYYNERYQTFQLTEFSRRASGLLERASADADVEKFLLRTLLDDLKESSDHSAFLEKLKNLRKESGERLACVLWNDAGKVVENDHFNRHDVSEEFLEEVYRDMKEIRHQGHSYSGNGLKKLQKILGPHLKLNKLVASMYFGNMKFLQPDASGKNPEFWVAWGKSYLAMVFYDRKSVDEDFGIKSYVKQSAGNDIRLEFFHSAGKDVSGAGAWFERAVRNNDLEGRSAVVKDGIMVAGRKMSGKRLLVAFKRFTPLLEPGRLTCLLALTGFFALALIVKGSGLRLDHHSVKLQLLLMLLVTTGLPFLLLAVAASDHVARKRTALIEEAYQTCIGYVQHVDRRSQIINSTIINQVNRLLKDVRSLLPDRFGAPEINSLIKAKLQESLLDYRLVASSPPRLMSELGVLEGSRFAAFNRLDKPMGKVMIDLKVSRDIAASYLAEMNNLATAQKMTETELVAEMVYQRPFHEIIQSMMLATDKVFRLGLVDRTSPLLVKLISLKHDRVIDYFLMIFFRNGTLQREFLARNFHALERNQLGLKFMYADNIVFGPESTPINRSSWFSDIYLKTREHPAVEPCFTSIDGHDYVYAGMRGQNLDSYMLYAFYPLARIEAEIAEEKQFLVSAAIMTLIMLAGLGLIFSAGFVMPLTALQAGAIAIRQRDFSFRLGELANDEFGEMARIFNSSMADFEELSLAGIVQARLLPQQGISDNRFDLYGRSIPMTEMGGDYFDYFQTGDDRLAVMAGDVAGHGVGASLIMAMAKAGVLRCSDCLDKPATVLARLHQIIFASRSKTQRKVMTFQYLYYNPADGSGVYANAGACSPLLVDPAKGTAHEITLQAPVLGGFKKSSFANLDLQLQPGQAVVFYTDGMVETMNPDGSEIGYDGLKQILLAAYDPDARRYYDNIYQKYREWLAGGQPQDDLTLIILLRRP